MVNVVLADPPVQLRLRFGATSVCEREPEDIVPKLIVGAEGVHVG
jgi:hypothetical protein